MLATHHAQCAKWSAWILSYCRSHKFWKLSLVYAIDSELFWNRKIDRRLAINDAREVLEWMRGQGRVEWVGEEKNVCWVWWRTPEEWAVAISEWVSWSCCVLRFRLGMLVVEMRADDRWCGIG